MTCIASVKQGRVWLEWAIIKTSFQSMVKTNHTKKNISYFNFYYLFILYKIHKILILNDLTIIYLLCDIKNSK